MFSAEYINGVLIVHSGLTDISNWSKCKVFVDGTRYVPEMILAGSIKFIIKTFLDAGIHYVKTDFGACHITVKYDEVICIDCKVEQMFIKRPIRFEPNTVINTIEYHGTNAMRYYPMFHVDKKFCRPADISPAENVIVLNLYNKHMLFISDKIVIKARTHNKDFISNAVNHNNVTNKSLFEHILPPSLIQEIAGYNFYNDLYRCVKGVEKYITNYRHMDIKFKSPEKCLNITSTVSNIELKHKCGWVYLYDGKEIDELTIEFYKVCRKSIVMKHIDSKIETEITVDYDPDVECVEEVHNDKEDDSSWISKLLSWFR